MDLSPSGWASGPGGYGPWDMGGGLWLCGAQSQGDMRPRVWGGESPGGPWRW